MLYKSTKGSFLKISKNPNCIEKDFVCGCTQIGEKLGCEWRSLRKRVVIDKCSHALSHLNCYAGGTLYVFNPCKFGCSSDRIGFFQIPETGLAKAYPLY